MFGITSSLIDWFAVIALAMFVVSAVVLPWLLTRLPADYFDETALAERSPWPRHRALYWAWRLLKNLLGGALLMAGFVMLFTPGQGILTIVAGLWLMDLPGKRRWERNLISRPKVLNSINWIRQKSGQPPLRLNGQPKGAVPINADTSGLPSNDRTK
jgi:hypothetical protein